MSTVRIATRGSELALVQARAVARQVEEALSVKTELVPVKTTGDRLVHVSLSEVGGKGLFVKEVEEALLTDRADLAVHSAKDLPAALPAELELVAFPERADPRDALVCDAGHTIATLPAGARVGTGSARRTALLRALRPDLEIEPLRGNVPTRLGRVGGGGLDAVVLACAGLDRLGLGERITLRIPPEELLPAVAQGALAIEGRRDDSISRDAAVLCHAATRIRVVAERAFLAALEGDCNVPLAALAEEAAPGVLRLRGLVATSDGARIARAEATAPAAQGKELGAEVARAVRRGGGEEILAALRAGIRE